MLDTNNYPETECGVVKVIVKGIGFYYTYFKNLKTGIPSVRHKLRKKYPENDFNIEIVKNGICLDEIILTCRQLQFKYNKEKDYIGRIRYDLSDINGVDVHKIDIVAAYTIHIGDMVYHGSAKNFRRRRVAHLNALANNKHDLLKMQELYNAGHKPRFTVYKTADRETAYDLEQKMVDDDWGNNKLLNLAKDVRHAGKSIVRDEKYVEKQRQSSVRAKACIIDGVEYASNREASRALGIPLMTLGNRIKSKTFPNYKRVQ